MIRVIISLIILVAQGAVTFITMMVIYMIFVLLDYQGGVDSFIGTTLIQPIIGAVISVLTMAICLLIGLPIRISTTINTWWTKRIWLSIVGVLAGFTMTITSALPSMTVTINTTVGSEVIQRQIPNFGLAVSGWFLIAFSLLHLFPPYQLRIRAEGLITRYVGK